MKTVGILLHVYHLEAAAWEELVWGCSESDKLGTLALFASVLLDIPSDITVSCIIFSGPSQKDGLTEGAYTKRFLLSRIGNFADFPTLKQKMDRLTSAENRVFLERLQSLVVGPVIKNTFDEVIQAAHFFNTGSPVNEVLQIAAASHAPRCLQIQLVARRNSHMPRQQPWHVVASETCFAGTDIDDVVILEPPHRGDDPMLHYKPTLASALKPYFALNAKEKQCVIQAVSHVITHKGQ